MAIASVHRRAVKPGAHRIERRKPRRTFHDQAASLARTAAWATGFLLLGWLVAAGFYGLLVNV